MAILSAAIPFKRSLMGLVAAISLVATMAAAKPPTYPPDEIQPQDVGVTANALPCVSGGPTQQDAAIAAALNPQLTNKMRGYMNAYNTSCARAVVQAVQASGFNQRAGVIAIATVIVETSIANLDGGDLDSVGLFQQRASWGSFAERTNPVIATNKFLAKMQQLYPGGSWNTAPIGNVAADVQNPLEEYRYRYGVEANDAIKITAALWNGYGRVFHNVRFANNTWQGARLADGGAISQVATASTPAGDVHVFTLAGGSVYHNIRYTNSTWQGARLVDGKGNITGVAAAATSTGEVHLFTLAGGVYHNIRYANSSWQGARLADASTSITKIAATATGGDVHLFTLAGGVYHNLRSANSTWSGARLADGKTSITDIAAAATSTGDVHLFTVAGGVYHNIRYANSTWSGARLADASTSITRVAATATGGDVHLFTVAGGMYHNIRYANSTWQGAALADPATRISAAAATAVPNGDVHVLTIAP